MRHLSTTFPAKTSTISNWAFSLLVQIGFQAEFLRSFYVSPHVGAGYKFFWTAETILESLEIPPGTAIKNSAGKIKADLGLALGLAF